jgi:hypothetical protein
VLIVGVTSFREREQVPSLLSCSGGGFEWCVLAVVALFARFITLAPASPFIASKGRARVIFCGKVVKTGKMKER